MAEPFTSSSSHPPEKKKRSLVPWIRWRQWREDRWLKEQADLRAYLQEATPIALRVEEEYAAWRDAISEPIQDTQKAANASATFWWRVTEGLRRFEQYSPPKCAARYHKFFGDAIHNASLGADSAKNGFRAHKTYEVSRGLGFMDDFVEAMGDAEIELGRLLKKYRLLEATEGDEP